MHLPKQVARPGRSAWTFLLLSALALLLSGSSTPESDLMFAITPEQLQDLKLVYYSDYYSFIGSDARGRVAFALDNNRGRDGDAWQAEHVAVLHDDKAGWQHVIGSGRYYNVTRQLETIPNSPDFTFTGKADAGMTIRSASNVLELKISPEKVQIAEKRGLAEYRLSSAEATLVWKERTLSGRVIHEYLFLPAYNRLTRSYAREFDDFHGIYASIEDIGDLYIHRQKGAFFSPLIRKVEGFLFLKGQGYVLQSINVDVRTTSLAWGFYQWPDRWEGSFIAGPDHYAFSCQLADRRTISNWVTGGFALGIVKGTLISARETWKLYGLGELIE